jgi:hypothetical protein
MEHCSTAATPIGSHLQPMTGCNQVALREKNRVKKVFVEIK